jgi:hypothetical protein
MNTDGQRYGETRGAGSSMFSCWLNEFSAQATWNRTRLLITCQFLRKWLSELRQIRSADLKSAVSPICNRQAFGANWALVVSKVCGLQIRDTAEFNSALLPCGSAACRY